MPSRIVITGGPRTGKTTRANSSSGIVGPIRHTDSLVQSHDWSEASEAVSFWFDEPGPWIVEGVAAVRALRKWLAAHPDGKPCDVVLWLDKPVVPRSRGQEIMAKGCATVWNEIRPALEARSVHIAME